MIEKLARWAGFEPIHRKNTPSGGIYWSYVTYPDGARKSRLPDFTTDLNACYKWLVPKLRRISIGRKISLELMAEAGDTVGDYAAEIRQYPENKRLAFYIDSNPALAVCKVIERLIDGEQR